MCAASRIQNAFATGAKLMRPRARSESLVTSKTLPFVLAAGPAFHFRAPRLGQKRRAGVGVRAGRPATSGRGERSARRIVSGSLRPRAAARHELRTPESWLMRYCLAKHTTSFAGAASKAIEARRPLQITPNKINWIDHGNCKDDGTNAWDTTPPGH